MSTSSLKSRPTPPSWSSIPSKLQLALVCSIRTVDFFQQASFQACMFYQLAAFLPDAPESDISFKAGVVQGCFTAAQVFTSPLWGRAADSPRLGRKGVVLISLVGQGVSCVGVAFSNSFAQVAVWRLVGGIVNASVGGARTALSESTEKKYHPKTFLLLPLAWNIANIFGPIIGGFLSDPVRYHPKFFGAGSVFGGADGVRWLEAFPYAAPNLFSAFVLFVDAFLLFCFLHETLITIRHERDRGLQLGEKLEHYFGRLTRRSDYTQVDQFETTSHIQSVPTVDDSEIPKDSNAIVLSNLAAAKEELSDTALLTRPSSSRRKAITFNVVLVLITVALLDFQLGGFTGLWSMFLSTTPRSLSDTQPISVFTFDGGLGFEPSTIGLAMSILGVIGIIVQFTLYPRINARFGTLNSTSYSLFLFPVAYLVTPYLSLIAPYASTSSLIDLFMWACIILIALVVITARTFSIPGVVLLTNNAAPSPETLGTIHGLGAATSSAFRTLGPIVAGKWYQTGMKRGRVGEAWWLLALSALVGCLPVWWVEDGQ